MVAQKFLFSKALEAFVGHAILTVNVCWLTILK